MGKGIQEGGRRKDLSHLVRIFQAEDDLGFSFSGEQMAQDLLDLPEDQLRRTVVGRVLEERLELFSLFQDLPDLFSDCSHLMVKAADPRQQLLLQGAELIP